MNDTEAITLSVARELMKRWLQRGQVRCERCQSVYPIGDKHDCKASEPSS